MSLIDKLERKLGFLSKFNLMVWLIGGYALGYILSIVAPGIMQYLYFDPSLVMKGQIWRLVTFVISTDSSSFFMALITCMIYFSISKSVEQIVGTFRLNFFLLSGLIILLILATVYYYLFQPVSSYLIYYLTPGYQYSMLFVLFALMFPDARFLFMFFFPIRGKWMVMITVVMDLLAIYQGFLIDSNYGWLMVFMILASVLSLLLFLFLSNYRVHRRDQAAVNFRRYQKEMQQRGAYRDDRHPSGTQVPRHKCAVCGRTNLTDPDMDFRYCSKCYSDKEYCMEHLYTHIHVKDPNEIAGNFSGGPGDGNL